MSEKITWTHVDRYVRDAHDKRGMLPMGPTDADCTLAYIKWLERMLDTKEKICEQLSVQAHRAEAEIVRIKAAPKKNKQRIADLEQSVESIRRHLGLEL